MMHNLNDTQRVLLANAAQRDDHSLLPLPEGMRIGARTAKAIAGLLAAGLAAERPTGPGLQSYRENDDAHVWVFATKAGLIAIGVIDDEIGDQQADTPPPSAPAPRASKSAAIVALMQRPNGATLPELIAATGWLPHTTRAALTGLRKKGHAIERSARDGAACYRIVEAAA